MKIEGAPSQLMDALRNRGLSTEEIEKLDGERAFNEFCMWHGLIGWGGTLYSLAKFCMKVEK